MTNLTGNSEGRTAGDWRVTLLLAAILSSVAALSFGAVVGWIIYGGDLFAHAVVDGWALCF